MKQRRRPARERAGRTASAGSGDWVVGRRPAPFVIEKPVPYRPELWVLLDAGADQMIAVETMEAGKSSADLAEWVAGRVRPGVRLRVDEHEMAEALRQRLGGEVAVLEAPTPEIDGAIDALEAYSAQTRGDEGRAPQWIDGAAADAKTAFYDSAGRFERAGPWEKANDGQVLAIDVPALGWNGACVSILGQAEETFGLLLFRSLAAYVAFVRLGDAAVDARRPPLGPGVELFSINFDRPRDLPGGKKLAGEARKHGFVPGPRGRVPYVFRFSPDGVPTPLTTDDYRLATATLTAVCGFIERHEELFSAPPQQQVEERSSVLMPGGQLEVVVGCPPPDVQWHWGEEEPIDGLRRRDRDQIADDFHAARRAAGEPDDEADADRWAAQEMLNYKDGRGGGLAQWTPDDVTAFTLEHYPSHGSETGVKLQAMPSRMDAFLAWLAASGRCAAAPIEAARERLAECRERFLDQASDPGRFGAAKTVLEAMRAADVDSADPTAVEAFLHDFHLRLKDDPSLLPGHVASLRGKGWVWNGEDPPPDLRGPCPCGSGRHYRKCCLPR